MLLRAKGEGEAVDTGVGVTGMGLVGLDNVEVGSLTLGEAVLAVKLKLGNHDGVLSPAMHVEGGLGHDERTGVGDGGLCDDGEIDSGGGISLGGTSGAGVSKGVVLDETIGTIDSGGGTESVKGVGKGIDGVSVVERLGTEDLVKGGVADHRTAVINVGVRLDNPDKLLTGVVEVELDLVGGGTDRLVASELELSDEVLVGVLCESTTLVGVEEDVVNIEGSSNQRLVVCDGGGLGRSGGSGVACESGDGPKTFVDGAQVQVDLDLVVLKGNQRKSKTGVGAVPELEGHVKGGLRKGLAGSTDLAGTVGITRTIDISEIGVGDKGKLGGVTNHLEVTLLLVGSHGELVPDVHPVTILTVNALTSNLDLNLRDELLSGEIQPTSKHGAGTGSAHVLVNLGESNLKVGAVCKITVAANSTGHTATKISLTVKGLLDGFNSKVGIPAVGNLPEGNLGITSQVNVLCAVGYELHKASSHDYTKGKDKKTTRNA